MLIWHFPAPAYPDSSYYVDVAQALQAGHGFNVDFIWIFAEVGGKIPADPVLPIPSNAHWMPLASMVQVPFLAVFGNAAWVSAAPFALFGSLAAPLTWAIARDAGSRAVVAVGAGVLVAIPLLSAVYLVQPDNFSLYQPLVIGSLWMAARGLKGSPRAFALAGLLAGLATLSRNDGLLVLAALGLAVVWDRWRAWRSAGSRTPAIPLWSAAACVGLFVLVMAPWWLRQLAVFGSLSPSTASGKVLFIRDISEWNSITTPATLEHLLGMGIGPLIESRVGGLIAAIMIFITLVAGFVLAPFMVIGGWVRRRSTDFGPFFAYALLLFAFSAIVSAVHVPGGTFIHSAIALAPFAYILALEGIVALVDWIVGTPAGVGRRGGRAGLRRGRHRVRRPVHGGRHAGRARGLGGSPGPLRDHRRRPRDRRRGAGRPRHVHRCLRHQVLERPRRRRPGQRSARDDRGGRPRLRHPLARARSRRGGGLRRTHPRREPARLGRRPGDDPGRPGGPRDLSAPPGSVVSRREAVLSALLVFVVAFVARAAFASQIVFPKPEDTAYYVGVARNLIEGHGLVSDALWSYGTPPLVLPRPAFEVWLPLPTFLAALAMAVGGATFAAAQWSSVVVGSLVAVLAWRLAADVAEERGLPLGRARTLALGTGLTSAVYLPLLLHSALPDSTMPFAALALGACLLMTRLARDPRGARVLDPRLLGLGALIGLAALTRNEAVWLGLTWAVVALRIGGLERAARVRLVAVAGVVAVLVFAPWALRDWVVFGSPLPGQAATNALSVTGFDIFAWNDPPTLARYLAVGPARLVEMRVEGISHNLFDVLLLPGLPISILGLLALPWQGRGAALRPVVLLSAITFLFTSLVFPVATTWGTFLHAAGPVHVLLIISALLALDAGIARLGVRLGWTRPVAWLGALLGIFGSVLFSYALLPSFGEGSRATAALYDELGARMAAAGHPLDATAGPVITNFPIWLAESQRIPALALPDESPTDVLDLAHDPAFAGTHLLVIVGEGHGRWPAVLDTATDGAACFREIDLGPGPSGPPDPIEDVRAFEVVCP